MREILLNGTQILIVLNLVNGIVMMARWRWKKPTQKDGCWRWVFLVALAVNTTISAIIFIQIRRLYRIDDLVHSSLAHFLANLLISTTLFLYFVSPYFFRRLGGVAALGWIGAVLVLTGLI